MQRPHARILAALFCALLPQFRAAAENEVVAVSSKVGKDYVRKTLPDGTFKPETYAFGKGDDWRGARVDSTIDRMDFIDVARVLAVPLAEKGYFPTADPGATDLLIMVNWGTTRAPEHASSSRSYDMAQNAARQQGIANTMLNDAKTPSEVRVANGEVNDATGRMMGALEAISAEDQRREDTDRRTAALLGYDSWWVATIQDTGGTGLGYKKQDMLNELEEDRYFVVLTALDYPLLVKEKKSKMLWETRFSIREHGNAFDARIAGMAARASDYFGRDSKGLHHDELPEGKVILGPVKSLGVVPDK